MRFDSRAVVQWSLRNSLLIIYADVVQWIEQWTSNPQVVGSSPIIRAICGYVGIGRQHRLKICWEKSRAGSSPATRTIPANEYIRYQFGYGIGMKPRVWERVIWQNSRYEQQCRTKIADIRQGGRVWLNTPVLKTGGGSNRPWVQIPPLPPTGCVDIYYFPTTPR